MVLKIAAIQSTSDKRGSLPSREGTKKKASPTFAEILVNAMKSKPI